METLRFTFPEILSVIGVTQCVYVLVYVALRAGRMSRAGLALIYFLVLGLAFLADFAQNHLQGAIPHYVAIQWFLWFYIPPLSVLLIVQISQIMKTPSFWHFWVLALPPLAYGVAWYLAAASDNFADFLIITGLIAGGVSLLAIWLNRQIFRNIHAQRVGKDRYWLILALIVMNIVFLSLMFLTLDDGVFAYNATTLRTIFGLGFVYLVTTSLFRIYPQAVLMDRRSQNRLSDTEFDVAKKIEQLMLFDKVYQEASYSRMDLARECETTETIISRIVNAHFGKSFPQLMNEYRVKDAKQLLIETMAPVKQIGIDVGFNSLATFNRVFKEYAGESPSGFRKNSHK